MSLDLTEQLSSGRRLLLGLGSRGVAATGSGPSTYVGEISFRSKPESDQRIALELTRLGIISRGVVTSSGPTGKLSICGIRGEGECRRLEDGNWLLSADFRAEVLYKAIEERLDFKELEPGLLEPQAETFAGSLRATLQGQDDDGESGMRVLFSDLELTHLQGGLQWISQLRLPVSTLPPRISFGAPVTVSCPMEGRTLRKKLKLRPIAFRSGGNGQDHSGTSWADQFQAVKRVWGNCCLDFEAQDMVFFDNPSLRRSSDPRSILRLQTNGQDLGGIKVFLVDGVPPGGGGATFSGGTALAKIVITNANAGNPYLLAHELGHALGGLHPGLAAFGNKWVADPGTVLEPSSSPNSPNPNRNSFNNCRRARNPGLLSTGTACCINPTL